MIMKSMVKVHSTSMMDISGLLENGKKVIIRKEHLIMIKILTELNTLELFILPLGHQMIF